MFPCAKRACPCFASAAPRLFVATVTAAAMEDEYARAAPPVP